MTRPSEEEIFAALACLFASIVILGVLYWLRV